MRFPVYSHRSNPAIDPPIVRKKLAYIESLIADCQAFWIDPSKKHLGVRLRARLLVTRDAYQDAVNVGDRSGFDMAWHIKQSGYAGPLCWQLKRHKPVMQFA